MSRIVFAVSVVACPALVNAGVVDAGKAKVENGIAWYNATLLTVEGKGWTNTKAPWDRLPAKAEKLVRGPVWNLSRHSAGLCVRFSTAAQSLHVRWTLHSPKLAMPHMPATGVSGLDLYVKTKTGWRWLAVAMPRKQSNQAQLFANIPPGNRDYLLYLPLYNGTASLEIGIPKEATLSTAPPRTNKPILFYGTSITQGGCASRPGMVHTAILGRRLNRAVINLGFSGNGRMEEEIARLLGELDVAAYVIDCLPNMDAKLVTKRVVPFVKILRKAKPKTPILLVEDRSYSNAFLIPAKKQRNRGNRKALKAAFDELQKSGVPNLYYLEGANLLGSDGEATVDSSHPTDLGFLRQANAFERPLRKALRP